MKLRKGDNVQIISGKDRGKTGRIIRVDPERMVILVEGLNLKKKHVRPREQGKKGEIVQVPAAFPLSRAMIICPSCGKPTRLESRIDGEKKMRICKKCKGFV